MQGMTPAYNPPTRKSKDLLDMFGGIQIPFFFTCDVVKEGAPMKKTTTQDKMTVCVRGQSHGAKCFGLALQETYDDTALGQLRGYHFPNDTRQPIDPNAAKNPPIGVLAGKGVALIARTRVSGTPTYLQTAEVGPSGMIQTSANSENDALPIVFEGTIETGAYTGGTAVQGMYRISFDFPMNTVA